MNAISFDVGTTHLAFCLVKFFKRQIKSQTTAPDFDILEWKLLDIKVCKDILPSKVCSCGKKAVCIGEITDKCILHSGFKRKVGGTKYADGFEVVSKTDGHSAKCIVNCYSKFEECKCQDIIETLIRTLHKFVASHIGEINMVIIENQGKFSKIMMEIANTLRAYFLTYKVVKKLSTDVRIVQAKKKYMVYDGPKIVNVSLRGKKKRNLRRKASVDQCMWFLKLNETKNKKWIDMINGLNIKDRDHLSDAFLQALYEAKSKLVKSKSA